MYAVFENTSEDFRFIDKKSVHVPPHIHTALEIVYITKGTQEVGVGQELYHMEVIDSLSPSLMIVQNIAMYIYLKAKMKL